MSRGFGRALRLGILALAALAALTAGRAKPAAAQNQAPALYAFDEALSGDDERRLSRPTAVAAGRDGEIAVADAAGPSLWFFRDRGGSEGWVIQLSIDLPAAAHSLACGGDRYLVSTRQPGRLFAVEGPGYELRELKLPPRVTPGAVACLRDRAILVHDLAAGRLLVLDAELEVRTSVPLAGTVAALAPGPAGGFYATFPQNHEVRRYGANGEQLAVLTVPGLAPAPAWPVGLIVQADGEIVVADRHGGRLLVIETSGRWAGAGSRRGWEPGLLRFPADLAQLPDGRVAVADQGNGRVQLFRRLEE